MNISDQLIRDESIRLRPYKDSVGKLTIGVGRNLDDVGISESEADFMLANDISAVTAQLSSNLPWTEGLDDARRGVLLNMAFNMGIHGLLGFKNMMAAVQVGKYTEAANEMLDSKWATQVGARAHRLAQQMETGVWT